MAIPAILATVASGLISSVVQQMFGSASASQTTTDASQAPAKDDFTRVMATQLQNQRALNSGSAMQPGSSAALAPQPGTGALASASTLLGKTVTVNGSPLVLDGGNSGPVAYTLPRPAATVAIQVKDATGRVVRTLSVKQQGRGVHRIPFDGLGDDGRPLAAGAYTYQVAAADGSGRALAGVSTSAGPVTGVTKEGGILMLQVGAQRVPLTSVVGVLPGTRA